MMSSCDFLLFFKIQSQCLGIIFLNCKEIGLARGESWITTQITVKKNATKELK